MRLCVFEDDLVDRLAPLTLTRPAFSLWCGACSVLERQQRCVGTDEIALWVRPPLADLTRILYPKFAINDNQYLNNGPKVLANARWLPGPYSLPDLDRPRIGLIGEEPAYAVVSDHHVLEYSPGNSQILWDFLKQSLPQEKAAGSLIAYPWDLVEHNAEALVRDLTWFRAKPGSQPHANRFTILGQSEQVVLEEDVTIDPYVVADTRKGPVLIDKGVRIESFSLLEGPCYIGSETWIVGAKLRGGTIGPCCRVGGEFEESLIQGYTNKYHDGFLGHSYVGEWVNLAAGTQVSDLRNDYGKVKVIVDGEPVSTGMTKVGAFIGDHTKTGLNTLINCGTTVGAFCNLLPTGTYAPPVIPSFCQVRHGQLIERTDYRQLFTTASLAMRRRGREWTEALQEFFFWLYDFTAKDRRRALRDSEQRRMRRGT